MDLFIWSLFGLFTLSASSIVHRDVPTKPPHTNETDTTLDVPTKSPHIYGTDTAPPRPSYLVVSPSVLRPDVPFSLFISNLQDYSVKVTAEILLHRDQDQDQVLSSASAVLQGGDEKLLQMPRFDSSSVGEKPDLWLKVQGRDSSSNEELFSNRTSLQFEPGTQITLIQTDRTHYQPGHSVKIRVLSLQQNGTGLNSTKDIYIKDPGGNLLRQWLSVESFLGVSSLEFQLSQNPPQGQWTITATVQGVSTEKNFHVAHYVLPKFKVELLVPKEIFHQDTLSGTVTAKHFYGKQVEGTLSLSFTLHSHSRRETFYRSYWIEGKRDFFFEIPDFNYSAVEISFSDDYSKEYVEIEAKVTESTTGLQYSSLATVDLAKNLYEVSFEDHRDVLRPGSTFTAQLKVQRFDGSPPLGTDLPKVQITVLQQRTTPWTWFSPMDYQIPEEDSEKDSEKIPGEMRMELSLPEDGVIPLSIELREDTQTLIIDASFLESFATLKVHNSHLSPSESYLQIQAPASPVQAGSSVTMKIWSSFTLEEYHYLVKSGGQMVLAGTSSGGDLVLDLDSDWTPTVTVLVFVVLWDGEIVMDRIQLQVKQDLKNHVSLSWSANSLKPHQEATLKVSVSEPLSLVGILVVDMATKRDSAYNDITKNTVLEEMGKLDVLHKDQFADMMQMGDPYTLFTECELLVLTDALYREVYNPLMPALRELPQFDMVMFQDQPGPSGPNPVHTRTHFPETWIWTDLHTGDSETAEVSSLTPDSITSWVASAFVMSPNLGVGFLDVPVKLTVFLDFFISLQLPPFIVRGEELLLEIHLYNYKTLDLTVAVTVDQSKDFEFLSRSNGSAEVQTVTVKHSGAASVLVPIRAVSLGDVLLSVRAQSPEASDHIQKTLLVKPEGRPQSFTLSTLLSLTEATPTAEKSISYTIHHNRVPGSCEVRVRSVGDILGPAIEDLDSLIQMPYGCGEQNMINLAPMVYVLQYLSSTGETDSPRTERAKELMTAGYEQELSFQRREGSFSAFGDSDNSGSTWLSAFVLRCFLQARPFIPVGPDVLQRVVEWLRGQQDTDGHFTEPGRVIHTELVGGRDSELTLTAYVLIALLEDRNLKAELVSEVSSALIFLEHRVAEGVSSNYSLSLAVYALSLAESPNAGSALDNLLQRGQNIDGVPVWSSPHGDMGLSYSSQPRSTDIEMVGYVLLSLHRLGRSTEGLELVRWLSKQQNGHGGFGSTQDTVVALQALSVYASLTSKLEPNLNVTQRHESSEASFTVNKHNSRLVHQILRTGSCDDGVASVKAEGQGQLLFQVTVVYNVQNETQLRRKRFADQHEGFYLDVTTRDLMNHGLNLTVCFRLSESSGLNFTGMAILEVQMLTGYSLSPQASFDLDLVKKVETNSSSGRLVLYLDSVTRDLVCLVIPLILDFKVGKVQEAVVELYDYYEPRRRTVRTYSSVLKYSSSCSYCGSSCDACSQDNSSSSSLHYPHYSNYSSSNSSYYQDYYEEYYDYYHHLEHHYYDEPHQHSEYHQHEDEYYDYAHHHGDYNYYHSHYQYYGHHIFSSSSSTFTDSHCPALLLLLLALLAL